MKEPPRPDAVVTDPISVITYWRELYRQECRRTQEAGELLADAASLYRTNEWMEKRNEWLKKWRNKQ